MTLQEWNGLSKYVIEKQIGIEISKGRLYLVLTELVVVCLDALNKTWRHRQMIILIAKEKYTAIWNNIVKNINCRKRGTKGIKRNTGSCGVK